MRIRVLGVLAVLAVMVTPTMADWATTTVPAGTNPAAVAINPVTNKIYVADLVMAGQVIVIEPIRSRREIAMKLEAEAVISLLIHFSACHISGEIQF